MVLISGGVELGGACVRSGSIHPPHLDTAPAAFAEAPTVLDTYGYTTHQIESLARVLFGEVNPTGRLPVTVPRADGTGALFPFGHGLGY